MRYLAARLTLALLLGGAPRAWALAGSLQLQGSVGALAPGDTAFVDVRVSSTSPITAVQLTVDYDWNVIHFVNATIGQDLGPLGFTIWNVNPNPIFPPVAPGTNRVVAVQIYKGPTASFTGTNLRAAKLRFVVQPGYCRTSPIALDATCSHTQFVTLDGQTICSTSLQLGSTSATQRCISDAATPLAAVVRLQPNVPNPFNPTTRITFELVTAQSVRLAVYAADGRPIRVLADRRFTPGEHTLTWDGRDARGSAQASGVYWCRLQVQEGIVSRSMVLVR